MIDIQDVHLHFGGIRAVPPANGFWPEQLGQARGFAPYPPGYWNQRR